MFAALLLADRNWVKTFFSPYLELRGVAQNLKVRKNTFLINLLHQLCMKESFQSWKI